MELIKFVDKPADILDTFEGKFRELAEEFRGYGGVVTVGIALRDDLEQLECHRFVQEPGGVAAYGLAMLHANECFESMYVDILATDDDG